MPPRRSSLPPILCKKSCEEGTSHRKYASAEYVLAQSLRGGVLIHRDDNYADVDPLRARTNDSLYSTSADILL